MACNDGGMMYRWGKGGDPDLTLAARMFTRACDRANGLGCSNLAEMHRDGTGVPQSLDKAHELLARACQLGVGDASRR